MEYADLVLQNGEIITMNSQFENFESIAIREGKIIALGSKPEVKRLIGPETRLIDLEERTVTPGLIDTHDHFLQHGIAEAFIEDIRYPKAKSIQDIKDIIEEKAKETEPGKWILATGWDETLLEERRYPNKNDLDPVSSENPIWIKRVFEMGVANSLALESAGINRNTLDPSKGKIDRGEKGEPNGLIRGRAMDLIYDAIPEWSLKEKEEALKQACKYFLEQGFTTVIEPGILAPEIKAYRSMHNKGELNLRALIQIGFLHDVEEVQWALDNYVVGGDDRLRIIGLKFAVDGGIGPRTALLYQPYEDMPENRGVQLIEEETLQKMVIKGHEEGFQLAIHAIGDKAIDIAIGSIEGAMKKTPRPDPRHQLVHCYFPSKKAIENINNLGIMVNTQTPFLYFLGDSFIEALGKERAKKCMPVKTLIEHGIPVATSHDSTVTPPLPPIGLYASVNRRTIKGEILGKKEAVTPYQALRMYTDLAAKHCFMEDKIGTLELGKYADLAVWDKNPLEIDPEELKTITCVMTVLDGEIKHQKNI